MAKQQKINVNTSFDSIYERFQNSTLLKTDYQFIAAMFREFKQGSIQYRILKAKINDTITSNLRFPKKAEDSQLTLGRLEGLDACLAIIDQLAKFDDNIVKEEKDVEEDNVDREMPIVNEVASIQDI